MSNWVGRIVGVAALVVCVGGCSSLNAHCTKDTDCEAQQYCDPDLKACLQEGTGSWALGWVTPADQAVVGGTVALSAKFNGQAGATPSSLKFGATLADGGSGGTGTLAAQPDGTYQGTWSPTAEGTYGLVATYEGAPVDGGAVSSAVAHVRVDLTAPTLVVAVEDSGVPHGTSGPTTYDDPAAGYAGAYRRDEVRASFARTIRKSSC